MGWLAQGFRIGDCEVRPEDGTVAAPSGPRRLGPRPMALLMAFAAQPGKVFSREELMAEVWPGLVVADETLSRCISDIRQALDDDRRSPRYVETLPRRGYRLIEAPSPLQETPAVMTADAPATAPAAGPPSRYRRIVPWAAASLAVLLAAGGWLAIPSLEVERPAPEAEAPLAENGIAVLAFANLSDDPALEYFSSGLSEELIHRLSGIEALAVVARTSAFAFKDSGKDVREIGRALGVAYVLDGSVRRHGDRVRIGAQLVDVRNGFHLFSRVYERPFSDLLTIQEHVALEVGAALEPRLAGLLEGLETPPAETTPEALEAYLLGKHLQRKHSADDLERSALEFRRAIKLDAGFARPYAGLAETLALTSQYAGRPIADVRDEIQALIAKAQELDPQSALPWHAAGLLAFYENRFSDALAAFGIAQERDPNAIGSIGMQAWTLRSLGRNREALGYTTTALRKDPINVHTINIHATLLAQLGETSRAERWFRRSLDVDPRYLNAFWGLGYMTWLAGRHGEAVDWYEAGIDAGIRQAEAYMELAMVLLEQGDYLRSRQWIDAGLARATDPVRQLDVLLAWHQYQGDYAGVATAVRDYDERFPEHIGMPPYRAYAALLNGDPNTAIREYESLAGRDSKRLHSHWDLAFGHWHALHLACARQLAGRTRAAELTLSEADEHLAAFAKETGFPGVVAYYRAAIASLRNEPDRVLAYLEEARLAGWRRTDQVRTSPLFAAVRNDPRVEELLGRVRETLAADRLAMRGNTIP